MKGRKHLIVLFVFIAFISVIASGQRKDTIPKHVSETIELIDTASDPQLNLPQPYATKSVVNVSRVIGWMDEKKPIAPPGFNVKKFADGFQNPRWIYVAPNGDVFVSEASTSGKSADRITILRDENKDGIYELREEFLNQLNKPFGMLIMGKYFYVANTDVGAPEPKVQKDNL